MKLCPRLKAIILRGYFSYLKAQLALEILATLSEQDINQALYFQKNLFRIEQLTILFATQEVLH